MVLPRLASTLSAVEPEPRARESCGRTHQKSQAARRGRRGEGSRCPPPVSRLKITPNDRLSAVKLSGALHAHGRRAPQRLRRADGCARGPSRTGGSGRIAPKCSPEQREGGSRWEGASCRRLGRMEERSDASRRGNESYRRGINPTLLSVRARMCVDQDKQRLDWTGLGLDLDWDWDWTWTGTGLVSASPPILVFPLLLLLSFSTSLVS